MNTADAIRRGRRMMGGSPGWKGKLNTYTCDKCQGMIVTRDQDAGVTPYLMRCRATNGCEGYARSGMYGVNPALKETYLWVVPAETETLTAQELDHVSRGGLLLRAAGGGVTNG